MHVQNFEWAEVTINKLIEIGMVTVPEPRQWIASSGTEVGLEQQPHNGIRRASQYLGVP
jgi:hypothetical protein